MNPYRVISEAQDDLQEAVGWYDLRDEEVGNRLANEFFAALPKLAAHPRAHPAVYKEFRRVLLKPFPYWLYYRLDGATVVVALLFHTSRHPRTSRELLDQRRFL